VVLPRLPKKDAAKYDVQVPFVCRGSKNFDSVKGYLTEEAWFKRAAMLHAARVVIVRSEVETEQPFIFIFDVQLVPPAGILEQRVSLTTLASEALDIPGLAAPTNTVEGGLYLLQGTKVLLEKYARRVLLRGVVAGTGDSKIFEAVGFPIAGWEDHLLGAPLHFVQRWAHAPRRATVKPVYDDKATMYSRFCSCGEFRRAFFEHVAFAWLDGFNFRVVLKAAFTHDYKRFLSSPDGIASVFTDARIPPAPERIGDEATLDELAIAAHTVSPGETAVHAGLVTTTEPPADLWSRIAAGISARVLGSNANACVFAVASERVGALLGKVVGGWARLSIARTG
jgi:hypothetical protein